MQLQRRRRRHFLRGSLFLVAGNIVAQEPGEEKGAPGMSEGFHRRLFPPEHSHSAPKPADSLSL